MKITYTAPAVSEIGAEDKTFQITYTNEQNFTHERTVYVPRLENGSVDEEYYQEILEGQFLGVKNKVRIGAIEFTDPNADAGISTDTP